MWKTARVNAYWSASSAGGVTHESSIVSQLPGAQLLLAALTNACGSNSGPAAASFAAHAASSAAVGSQASPVPW